MEIVTVSIIAACIFIVFVTCVFLLSGTNKKRLVVLRRPTLAARRAELQTDNCVFR